MMSTARAFAVAVALLMAAGFVIDYAPLARLPWEWIGWGVLLLAQNASFTLVSRARNSGSISYHALAAVGSNGIWFISQLILVGKFMDILKGGAGWRLAVATGVFYTVMTIVGSVGMHYIAMHKIEKGNMKVGG